MKRFILAILIATVSPAQAQIKKFSTDSLRVNSFFTVGFPVEAYSGFSGPILGGSTLVLLTDTTDASLFAIGNIAGRWTLWSYKTGGGAIGPIDLMIGLDVVARFDENNNFGVAGQTNFGENAVNVIAIPNGTAPTTSPPNTVLVYAEDVSGSSELKVRNEAGNVTVLSTPIGDTTVVDIFPALDTTSTNCGSGSISLSRFSIRRTIQFWSYDDTNSDTTIFSIGIPEKADSLVFIVPIFRANASTGNYVFNFLWEFTANDAAIDNSLSYTNSTGNFTVSAPSASGDIRDQRKTIAAGAARSPGGARWMDGAFIRVGGNGSDTASGNADLIGLLMGWSRKK